MSKEREVEAGATNAITNEETKEQRKARIARVLERGIVSDRLAVDLPEHLHGEWVRDNAIDIERMRALGFEIDTTYAKTRALHDDAGKAKIGDVIFMTAPKDIREMVGEFRQKKFNDFYKKQPKSTRAEQSDIDAYARGNEVEVNNLSSVSNLSGPELLSTLEREAKK